MTRRDIPLVVLGALVVIGGIGLWWSVGALGDSSQAVADGDGGESQAARFNRYLWLYQVATPSFATLGALALVGLVLAVAIPEWLRGRVATDRDTR